MQIAVLCRPKAFTTIFTIITTASVGFLHATQAMKAGYSMATGAQSGVCKREQPCHQSPLQSAGPLQSSSEQPHLLQASASYSTPAQGCMQQPSLHAAPQTPIFPQQGSLPQQPCPQGMPLQPYPGQGTAAVRPSEAQTPALVPVSEPQQLEDEEVCCAQPALPSALPSALPQQQLASRGNKQGPVQEASYSTGLPADRTSSTWKAAGNQADQNGYATLAGPPTQHGDMQRAPGAGLLATGGTVQAPKRGQEQPCGSHASEVLNKENAGTGIWALLLPAL